MWEQLRLLLDRVRRFGAAGLSRRRDAALLAGGDDRARARIVEAGGVGAPRFRLAAAGADRLGADDPGDRGAEAAGGEGGAAVAGGGDDHTQERDEGDRERGQGGHDLARTELVERRG